MTREVRNILWLPEDGDPKLALIPRNYLEKRIEPICIRMIDDERRPVYPGWIEAACRTQHSLRFFARTIIHDLRLVSELAECSVHALSAEHWDDLGTRPHFQLFVYARWLARDMAVGTHRIRIGKDVELPPEMLFGRKEEYDFEEDFANRDLFIKLEKGLREAGRHDTAKMVQMYLSGTAHEIENVFGIPSGEAGYRAKNSLWQRVRRDVRRQLEFLKIPRNGHNQAA